MKRSTKLAACLDNSGNEVSLILGKIYAVLRRKDQLIRVRDENEESTRRDRNRRHRIPSAGHPTREAGACEPVGGYTNGMKTAISLPDGLYREAERLAKRTRKSRSQLYAEALAEYLARHSPDEVTERMNQVLDELGTPTLDPFLDSAVRRVLKDVEW